MAHRHTSEHYWFTAYIRIFLVYSIHQDIPAAVGPDIITVSSNEGKKL